MKISLVFLCLFFSLNASVFAQKTTLRGRISDAKTGEALPGVSVYIPQLQNGTASDVNGNYEVSVPAGNMKVVYTLIGYANQEKQLEITKPTELNITLEANAGVLKEVQISAKKNALREQVMAPQMSTIKLSPLQMKNLPSIGGEVDIIKVAQLLPVVKRGGEGQTGMYVRGGGADQNLIL